MSEELPNLCYYNNDEYNFNKPYSDDTAQLIDKEVKKMIAEQYERAKSLLLEHRGGHAELAKVLVEKEVIFAEDVEKIFGKRPWASRSEEIMNKEEGQFLPTNGQEEKSESENKEE
jgi:cell division protease FtsH